jgi:crossover junction endodeoxyribonuclease RuvC
MIILALDSGVEKTGYSVFKKVLNNFEYISSGLIKTSKTKTKEKRMQDIYDELTKIIKKYKPNKIILEQLFFFKNQKTAIQVSQSQGISLLIAAQNNIEVSYLTPLEIKYAITGYGRADKKAIQKMIKITLKDKKIKQDDEADAIACGLAYCYINKSLK